MHLVALTAENFRLFGSEAAGTHLRLEIKRGLTVLVGENDAGKSAVIDALRLVLGAKGQDFLRVSDDDFHRKKGVPADSFRLHCRFEGLSDAERARFLEWLSLEDKEPALEVTLLVFRAKRKNRSGVETFVADSSWRSGPKGAGRAIEGDLRSYLLSTYLKPLRDAEMEMAAGRGSRLSQLLLNHPALKGQDQPSDIPAPETGKPLRGFADVKLRGEYCRDAVQPSFDFSDTPEHGTLLPGRLEIGSSRKPRPMGRSSLAQAGTPTGKVGQ